MFKDYSQINYPADVPKYRRSLFRNNWQLLTKKTGRLLLLAGDQRIEHLNDDFFGPEIDASDNNPEHLLQIAKASNIGAIAVHYGLASRYGETYRRINYVIKLNGKTNLVPGDPDSRLLATVDQSIELSKQAGFRLVGVGYTIYLGSQYEGRMLSEAAEVIRQAHDNGLLAILWVYPKGVNVKAEESAETIAGATGVAVSLGADFVKVKLPKPLNTKNIERIVGAAGLTRVIFAGGSSYSTDKLLKDTECQLKAGGAGLAIGRNAHQKSLVEATKLMKKLAEMIYEEKLVKRVLVSKKKK
ncbi:MAG TPA: aldolase [bacterium]|nr:aldolase [bacterium]